MICEFGRTAKLLNLVPAIVPSLPRANLLTEHMQASQPARGYYEPALAEAWDTLARPTPAKDTCALLGLR